MGKKTVVSVKDIPSLEELVRSKNTVLLLHATWCIHCQMFGPQWDVLLQRYIKRNDVQLLSIESEVIKKLSEKNPKLLSFLAQTPTSPDLYFPKIMMFIKGAKSTRRMEYSGDRNADAVQAFIDTKMPAPKKK